ncbi:MAG: cobyrinate a,c-diamide synthase [Desulfatiglandaceae bacterium]
MHPRIIIAALRGGSGKTILSLGLVSAWKAIGYSIAPFKKGPDFIDAGWLTFAADRPCHNLDPFLMTDETILHSFGSRAQGADLSVIEGNRGLYDGLDTEGSSSTAELAKLLKAPVLIILDVSMTTRTMAAVVRGCQVFDAELNIAGIILNRVAGPRQGTLIRDAIEKYCHIPVVGSVPKLKGASFPERHMGLVPHQESTQAECAVAFARRTVEDYLQLDQIHRIAAGAPDLDWGPASAAVPTAEERTGSFHQRLRIGYIEDKSFWFYYPENLEQLKDLGADLIRIDAMSWAGLPDLDALYIGGGFPETQAEALSRNTLFRRSLKDAIERGLPVYAECGGFMYLGERLIVHGKSYPMVGALPLEFVLQKKPQGHGYTVLEVVGENRYYSLGQTVRGHEFHYSRAVPTSKTPLDFVFHVHRGQGIDGKRDGISKKNLLASYTHVHAQGDRSWARGLFQAALRYKKKGFFEKKEKNI